MNPAAWFRDDRSFPWRVFGLAAILRLIPVLAASGLSIGLDDMFQYDMLARSLASGNGFRWYAPADVELIRQFISIDTSTVAYDPRGVLTTFRAPLYPAFLALVYAIVGIGPQRFFAARLVQALLTALLAPLTFWLAARLFRDNVRAAKLAAVFIACYPMLIIYPLALATENLFFVLVLSGLVLLLAAIDSGRLAHFALAGFVFGLATLTRSIILFAVVSAALWLWFALRRRREAALLAAALCVTIAPWVVRNSLLTGRPTGVETSLGYNLYVGYHPQSTGTFTYGPSLDLLSVLDDGTRDRLGTSRALEFIREDPARVPYLAVLRTGYFFGLERRALTYFYSNGFLGYIPAPALILAGALIMSPFIVLAISCAFGFALTYRRRELGLLVLMMLAYTLPHILILAEDRFHLALVPVLAAVAAQAWTGGRAALRAGWGESGDQRLALMLAGLGAVLLVLNWGMELSHDSARIALLLGPYGNQTYFAY